MTDADLNYRVTVLRTAIEAALESLDAEALDEALAHLRGVLVHLDACEKVRHEPD